MALKAAKEVRHVQVEGTLEQLDSAVTGYVNDGWEVLEVKIVAYDAYNGWLKMLYILGKRVRSSD